VGYINGLGYEMILACANPAPIPYLGARVAPAREPGAHFNVTALANQCWILF